MSLWLFLLKQETAGVLLPNEGVAAILTSKSKRVVLPVPSPSSPCSSLLCGMAALKCSELRRLLPGMALLLAVLALALEAFKREVREAGVPRRPLTDFTTPNFPPDAYIYI
jgi:hypothetical protein